MLTEEEIMANKRTVKKAMKGFMPEEKTRAWRSVHNYMQIADLQQQIADVGDTVELGEGNYAADIVIVTDARLDKAGMDLLRSILRAIDILETEIYRTVASDQMYEITEIGILNPVVIVYFGGHNSKWGIAPGLTDRTQVLYTRPIPEMLPDAVDSQTAKAEVWGSLREIMQHYDAVIEREKG